jgi:hypothetical protein
LVPAAEAEAMHKNSNKERNSRKANQAEFSKHDREIL